MGAGVALYVQREAIAREIDRCLPIRYVRFEGDFSNVDPDELCRGILPQVARSYFAVDLQQLERTLADLSWVGSVRVARVWPDTLVVELREQLPAARWGDGSLISDEGEVFRVSSQTQGFDHLPQLSGPRGREAETLALLRALGSQFSPQGLQVTRLTLSERLALTVELSNGLKIAYGNQEPVRATEHFLSLLPRLGMQRFAALRTLDLRYPRGFAVTWKPVAGEDEPAASPAAPDDSGQDAG